MAVNTTQHPCCSMLFFVPNSPYALPCLRSLTNEVWSFLLAWLYTHSFLVLLITLPSGVHMWDHFLLFL